MSEVTKDQKLAAQAVYDCCTMLSSKVTAASELGLEVEIEILPYFESRSGRRVSVPKILASVKKVEVL